MAIILGLDGGLIYYKKSVIGQLEGVDKQLVDLESSRNKKDEQKLLSLKDSLALVQPLILNHTVWSGALTRIQGLINPKVQFDSLSVNLAKAEYTFRAFAADYATVAKQIAAFYNDDQITDVIVGKVTSLTDSKVEFTAVLNLDINRLVKKNLSKK